MKNVVLLMVLCLLMAFLLVIGEDAPTTPEKEQPASSEPDGKSEKDSSDNKTPSSEQPQQTLEQILSKPFTAKLKNVEVRELLRSLSKIGPLNIFATKSVSGQLTFLLENVTIGDALEIVLITNGLAKEIRGKDIIHIMTETEYQSLYGKPYNTRLVAKTYQLQHTQPKKIMAFLDFIRSKNLGSIIPDDGTKTLLVIDIPEKIQQMEEFIKRLDVPPETVTFELQNANIDDIIPEVNKLITTGYGDVKIDKRMKRFIVTDNPMVLENIAHLVREFDGRPREVLIEAKMIQILLTDEYSMGIKWTQVFSQYSAFKDVKLIGNFPIRGDLAQKVNLNATIGTIPQTHYELVVNALKAFGDNKLISAPRLICMADKEARFMVGTKEAYATTSRTTATGGATTETETVQFIDVGVSLFVTPAINENGYITMAIRPEISSVVRYEPTGLGNRIPIVETANTNTNVMVKDTVSIVIAGLIKDEKRNESAGVPFLSQIPIFGSLFSSRREYFVKTETVIFLTPHIMTGNADSTVPSKQYDMERKEPKDLKPIK